MIGILLGLGFLGCLAYSVTIWGIAMTPVFKDWDDELKDNKFEFFATITAFVVVHAAAIYGFAQARGL